MSWLRAGLRVFVLREERVGGSFELGVARAEVVADERRVVVVKYDDGTLGRIPRGYARRLIWTTEKDALQELRGQRARSSARSPLNAAPSTARRVTPPTGTSIGGRLPFVPPLANATKPGVRAESPLCGLCDWETTPHTIPGARICTNPSCRRVIVIDGQVQNAEESVSERLPPIPQHEPAESSVEQRRALGGFVRLIVAGSVGLAAQRIPLDRINLGRDERELAQELEHHLATNLGDLIVEQRILWGALMLYVIARTTSGGVLPDFLGKGVPPALLSFIESGVTFWERKAVLGAPAAFEHTRAVLTVRADGEEGAQHHEVEAMRAPRMLGRERVRLRLSAEDVPGDFSLEIGLRVPGRDDILVQLEDAPGAALTDRAVRIPAGEEWTDVLFRLVGQKTEQVHLEAFVVGMASGPVAIDGLFAVGADERAVQRSAAEHDRGTRPMPHEARKGVESSAVDRVFEHIRCHGYVTEAEAVTLLGSARAFRAFSAAFESHLGSLPFGVRVEVTSDGKRYVREDES